MAKFYSLKIIGGIVILLASYNLILKIYCAYVHVVNKSRTIISNNILYTQTVNKYIKLYYFFSIYLNDQYNALPVYVKTEAIQIMYV